MPPRGVKKGTKRARQYEHVKESVKKQGRSESRAEEIAARTVNKERARAGESGRTRAQLYNDARKLGIEGRSNMDKEQLQQAVAGAGK
jgi:plasmid stabilization system protein ParE